MTKQNDFSIDWERGRSPAALIAKLEGFEAVFFEEELPRAAEDIALRLERDAKKLAPVGETGNLQGSTEGLGEKIASHTVRVLLGSDVEYAPFPGVRDGHNGRPAVHPTSDRKKSQVDQRACERGVQHRRRHRVIIPHE